MGGRTHKLSCRAAWTDVMPGTAAMAARSACMFNVTPGLLIGSTMEPGVARRSFGLLRYDLLLQIDPSVTDLNAGYILRHRPLITSFRCVRLLGGPSRLRPLPPVHLLWRSHVSKPYPHSAFSKPTPTHRCWHRTHLRPGARPPRRNGEEERLRTVQRAVKTDRAAVAPGARRSGTVPPPVIR